MAGTPPTPRRGGGEKLWRDSGRRDMRFLTRLVRLLFSRQAWRLVLRAAVILSMSFAMAFGFLAGSRGPWSNYDPYLFAVGTAALFGAACGAIGLLVASRHALRARLRAASERIEELADRNWELKEVEEKNGRHLELKDMWAPIVIQMGRVVEAGRSKRDAGSSRSGSR